MTALISSRLTLIWVLMLAATLVSWEAVEGIAWLRHPKLAGAVVVGIAFIKARYIMLDFMELRNAPVAMRLFAEAWWLLIGGIIVAAFWTAMFALA